MLVAELAAYGEPLRFVERPVPDPGPGEVRVRIEACGVCGSDLFLQRGGFVGSPLPIVPGHEAAGVVDAVGSGVGGFTAGDQVAIYYIDAPPDSRYARSGHRNIGPGVQRMGVDVDGAFAEYVVRPWRTLLKPAAPVDPVVLAVLTDAVATPYHALVRIAELRAGESLLVLGVGGIGSNAVQLGHHLGARVIAVGRSPGKLELARRLGADVVLSDGPQVATEIRAETEGLGPDVVLQCGASARLDELAIEVAGFLGRVVLVATTTESFSARASAFVWKELSVRGSRGFLPEDIAEVIELHLAGAIATDHLTTARRPLTEANEALADLASGRVLRTVLEPLTKEDCSP
ncbi:MAG TPA: zinc-binding dehydrogenase [Acidimicrobiales bacterium]|nr:zinc-binding dehydrogenase [Acidimicrobiales bacterium]